MPLVPLVQVHELTQGGLVMQDENVKVTAALVDHPPVVPAFAYRFDARDRSIVISGDTTPSDNLVELAQGADVLVHDALFPPASTVSLRASQRGRPQEAPPRPPHSRWKMPGAWRQAAGVKTLVLSHFIPPEDPPG